MGTALYASRRARNLLAQALATLAAAFGLFWLVWILWTTVSKGMSAMNLDLFTMMTPPPDERGGLLNAFFGSALISVLAICIGTPVGVLAGTFLAEYAGSGWSRRLCDTVRFVNDILLSAPSIVLGLFVYTLVVARMGHFSALAGGISLAFIVLSIARLMLMQLKKRAGR